MKYLNAEFFTNLISLALVICLFCACGTEAPQDASQSEEPSAEESSRNESSAEVPSEPAEIPFTAQMAKALLEQDKKVTEMFICNSLCATAPTEAVAQTLSEESEFSEFSSVEQLVDATYSSNSAERSFFMSYPQGHVPSVSNSDGKTSVFFHPGSGYTDFADPASVSVSATDDVAVKTVTAKTLSGKSVSLTAVYEDKAWKLEKGIYLSNPPVEEMVNGSSLYADMGSLKGLSGNILVIEFFISDKETAINSDEEKAYHQKILSATEKIETQAAEYETALEFTFKPAYFEHENVLGTRVMDFDLMFAETGFSTLQAFAEDEKNAEYFELDKYDGYFFAVCMEKDIETSFGLFDNTDDTKAYYGERILIGNSSSETEIYKSILRLSGAYGFDEGILDSYTESLFKAYFPDDPMLNEDMTQAVMSPITACFCGITKEVSSFYKMFFMNK